MFCEKCGNKLVEGAVFCSDCGHKAQEEAGNAFSHHEQIDEIDVKEKEERNSSDCNFGRNATASLILGIIGIIAWIIPIIGLPIQIVGLVNGTKGLKSSQRGMAISGLVLCIIGLVASIINATIGAYLGYTGQLFN